MPVANMPCPPGEWMPVSASTITAFRMQLHHGDQVYLMATATDAAPTSTQGALELVSGDILAASTDIGDLFPHLEGADPYLWLLSDEGAVASVSYA